MKKGTSSHPEVLVCTDFVTTISASRNVNGTSPGDKTGDDLGITSTESSPRLVKTTNNLSRGSAHLLRSEEDCDVLIASLLHQPRSLSEETQHRDCLTKAITCMCKHITENTVITGYELDILESEICMTGEDRVHVLADSVGPIKRARRLLSLMLLRDYRALLVFLKVLLCSNGHVVENILRESDKYLQINYRKPPKCTLCQLDSRVDMVLIIDDLLSDDDEWMRLYVEVSQTDRVGPNTGFWRKLSNEVIAREVHGHVSDIIINALSNCGFHSDIVKMLNKDKLLEINSFVCRCGEMSQHCRFSRDLRNSKNLTGQNLANSESSKDLLQKKGRACVEHDGFIYLRTINMSKTGFELSQNIVPDNRTLGLNKKKDENINKDTGKKRFSSKNKELGALNECRPERIEGVQEINDGKFLQKGQGWSEMNKQQDHTTNGGQSHSKIEEHQAHMLTVAIHEPENMMEILKEWPGATSSLIGSTCEEQSYENHGIKLTFLKDDTHGKEISQMDLLKPVIHETCNDIDTLKTNAWQEEISTTNGIDDDHQTYENDGIKMLLLKDAVFTGEIEAEATILSGGTNSFDSIDTDQPLRFDMGKQERAEWKTAMPKDKDLDNQVDHKLSFLKIGIPDYESYHDSGFFPYQSMPNSKTGDSVNDLETITDDEEEAGSKSTDNYNHQPPNNNSETQKCTGYTAQRSHQAFKSKALLKPWNQAMKSGFAEWVLEQDSITEARNRVHNYCSNENDVRSELINLLIAFTFICLFSYVVQQISNL